MDSKIDDIYANDSPAMKRAMKVDIRMGAKARYVRVNDDVLIVGRYVYLHFCRGCGIQLWAGNVDIRDGNSFISICFESIEWIKVGNKEIWNGRSITSNTE